MKFIDPSAQTNWKFIAIVAFAAVFLAGGILMLIPQFEEPTPALPQQNNSQIDTSSPAPSPSTPLGINSVEGWQTYRNDEFGFEVRYPRDFAIYQRDAYVAAILTDDNLLAEEQCNEKQQRLIDEGVDFGPGPCLFGVFINMKQEEALAKLYDGPREPYGPLASLGAIELYREYQEPSLAVAIPTSLDKNTFLLFEGYAEVEEYVQQRQTFRQILSTFRFVE